MYISCFNILLFFFLLSESGVIFTNVPFVVFVLHFAVCQLPEAVITGLHLLHYGINRPFSDLVGVHVFDCAKAKAKGFKER